MSVTAPTDADLAEMATRFAQGDMDAFAQLYKRFAPRVIAFLRPRCLGKIGVDDIAQEAWMRVWKARDSFDGGNFQAWLFQIVRHLVVSEYRRKRLTSLPEDFDVMAVVQQGADERVGALRDCLQSVGGQFVEVIRAQLDGLSTAELSAQFGVAEATIYTRVDRAKKQIAECVRKRLSTA